MGRAVTRAAKLHVRAHGIVRDLAGRRRRTGELAAIVAGPALLVVLGMVRRGKTRPDQAAAQPLRAKLVELICRRPGLRLCNLWKAMNTPRGTAQYHLFVLERSGIVESTHGAGASRYFPAGIPHTDALSLLLRGRVLDLAGLVRRRPGCNQGQLIGVLGLSRRVFREYADLLVAAGLLQERRDWRTRTYFPTRHLEDVLPLAEKGFGAAPGDNGAGQPGGGQRFVRR